MSNTATNVYTSGSWDLFHVGHLNILRESRKHGDRLVVGVSSDELIEEYKGVKPVIPFAERAELVAAVKGVDEVVEQRILMDIRILEEHDIHIATIGDDWRDKYLEGLEWMKKRGEVVYIPYTQGVSTSRIKRKIIENAYQFIHAQLQREIEATEEWKAKQAEQKRLQAPADSQ